LSAWSSNVVPMPSRKGMWHRGYWISALCVICMGDMNVVAYFVKFLYLRHDGWHLYRPWNVSCICVCHGKKISCLFHVKVQCMLSVWTWCDSIDSLSLSWCTLLSVWTSLKHYLLMFVVGFWWCNLWDRQLHRGVLQG